MAFSQGELITKIILPLRQKIGGRGATKRTCMCNKDLTTHNMNVAIISVAQYPSRSYTQNIYSFNVSIISYYDIVMLLRVQATLGRLKNLSGHSGIRTSDLWNTSPPPGKNFSACPVWLTLGVASQYHNIIFTRVQHHH